MHRGEREEKLGWAGVQLECSLCESIRFFLRDVPWSMMNCSHATQGWSAG